MAQIDESDLHVELKKINSNLVRIYKQKTLFRTFVTGIISGLGSVIGATVVLGLIIFILSKFDFLPIVQVILNYLPHK
jgi:hypothetical protein